jgi:outer membrane receptor protein involved in Fe transport
VFQIPNAGTLTARFDVINIFDRVYEIRNGTGVGVGAPQYGPRRGLFFGLSKSLGHDS